LRCSDSISCWSGLDIDARERRDVGDFLELCPRNSELLLVNPDLLVDRAFAFFEMIEIGDRRIATRDELLFLFGVQRLFFRRHGELALVSIELDHRVIASAALIAQRDFRSPRAILRDDASVVGGVQFLLHGLQLRRESGRAHFFGAEERFEIGELTLDGEDARRRAFGFSSDQNGAANDVAVERDECGVRLFFGAIDRLLKIADDVRLRNRAANRVRYGAFANDRVNRIPMWRRHSCRRAVRDDKRPAPRAPRP
jgi:hypothetical protein